MKWRGNGERLPRSCPSRSPTAPAASAHLHYHLADAETGRNLFAADHDARGLGLSELAYHFLGGVLAHARASVRRHIADRELL